jgi:hypothetical protein
MINPDLPLPTCFRCGETIPPDNMTVGSKPTEKDGEVVTEDVAVFHTRCPSAKEGNR